MYYYVTKGIKHYVALAKLEPFSHPGWTLSQMFYEPGAMWFEFGTTAEEAISNLQKSLQVEGLDITDQGTIHN